ncbi:MAG: methionyl-tRNA formyltransferase [Porphyromonadaceae bacterium]|nr:methionyl-tRNA formyltransferase [Porphyromonadaceae bacterium]
MEKEALRIVFMGTPDFAVESLKRLVEKNYQVVGVITMPDKPAGRGHKIQFSAVKQYALSQNLPILQPEKLKDPDFLTALCRWEADLQIVVAFRMLPEVVWDMPRYGTFNLHASLLPQYRGAAPINWAIINGEKMTGATTFFLTHEIDTGRIILQRSLPITSDDNAGSIHDKLMVLGADMVTDTVDRILQGNFSCIEQEKLETVPLHTAPKIFKEDCRIDWKLSAHNIHNFIRGLSPYPAAWCEWIKGDVRYSPVKIFETEEVKNSTAGNASIGTISTDGKSFIEIQCGENSLRILSLQLPGKKRLSVSELLRGFSLNNDFTCL